MEKETGIEKFFDAPIEHFPDRSARWLFEDVENVRGLIELFSGKLADQIEFSQVTEVGRSFIQDDLSELESDIVYRAPFRDNPKTKSLLIYILIEHQSTVDPTMAFRAWFYMTQIWDSQRREWELNNVPKSQRRFRPILPIVFYTGDEEWKAPLSLEGKMDTSEALSEFVPKFKILFLGVKQTEEATTTYSVGC